MSTQRRNRGASRSNTSSQGIPGGTFAAGLITGVVLTLAIGVIIPDRPPAVEPLQVDTEAPASQPNSNFQFYTLLSEQEIAVSDNPSATGASETEETLYWLQVSSFRNQEDADGLRASLILLNLQAEISPVNIQGTIWHRVKVGPFRQRTQMASARGVLIGNGFQPLPYEERQPRSTPP